MKVRPAPWVTTAMGNTNLLLRAVLILYKGNFDCLELMVDESRIFRDSNRLGKAEV